MHIKCTEYTIWLNDWSALSHLIKNEEYSSILVLVDENTREHCLPLLQKHLNRDINVITIVSGEVHKTLKTCEYIWQEMLRLNADRHSLFLNLGGGVIGDMGGFCAATYMRGMDFIQLPTTLLSQVDASVGGKLGVDLNQHKNFIGLIKPPKAVMVYTEMLQTLSQRELLSGYAEILKHGLIQDQIYWNEVKKHPMEQEIKWEEVIFQSIKIKKAITEADPTEKGLRKILNYGHTIGHAVESANLKTDDRLLHGEAIAIGMICEAYLSYSRDMITKDELDEITKSIINIYGHHPQRIFDEHNLITFIKRDKKNKGGQIRFSLLNGIGQCSYDIIIPSEAIVKAFEYYRSWYLD